MAILTNAGRTALAKLVLSSPVHLAWGRGDPNWDTTPVPELISDTELVDEIGRRAASVVRYCVPDENGSIIVPTGRFEESLEPTKHLYMRFNFDFEDAPVATIREVGVFIGTETDTSLPPGKMYFEPEHIIDPGILLVIERIQKVERSPSVRQTFEFVITF